MPSFRHICKGESHVGLIPLFVIIAGGCVMCAASCARNLMKDPDVCINRRSNPEPWEHLRGKQFQYLSFGGLGTECQAPKYWEQ